MKFNVGGLCKEALAKEISQYDQMRKGRKFDRKFAKTEEKKQIKKLSGQKNALFT